MNVGPLVTACVAVAAFGTIVVSFANNASPYVTVAEAKTRHGDRLHLAGDIQKNTEQFDPLHRTLTFNLKDSTGAIVKVVHTGEPPTNMQEATKVVAIGGMKNNEFVSTQLLVKCPSKYEAAKSTAGTKN